MEIDGGIEQTVARLLGIVAIVRIEELLVAVGIVQRRRTKQGSRVEIEPGSDARGDLGCSWQRVARDVQRLTGIRVDCTAREVVKGGIRIVGLTDMLWRRRYHEGDA